MTIARDWGADLIVREAAEYGGCLAAELLEIPHAVVRTDSGSSSYAGRHHVGPSLDAVRAEVGLPPDPDVAMPFRYLSLSFAPRCLDDAGRAAAPTIHYFRPTDRSGVVNHAPAESFEMLTDGPAVYATLGTVYNQPELLAAIIEALASDALNLFVSVGAAHDPAAFDPGRPNVRVERWIPQELLLPRCDAVVTHGGYGTVTAALSHGCPLVLLPMSADQPHNAAGCTAAGVGITVASNERDPETIRAATAAVLGDSQYRHAARAAASEMHGRPGLEHAVQLLDTLARQRIPIASA